MNKMESWHEYVIQYEKKGKKGRILNKKNDKYISKQMETFSILIYRVILKEKKRKCVSFHHIVLGEK